MTEPENHTLALLREMRAEIAASEARTREQLDRIEKRLDAMQQDGIKAPKGFIGHRAMEERTMGSFEADVTELKRRTDALETSAS